MQTLRRRRSSIASIVLRPCGIEKRQKFCSYALVPLGVKTSPVYRSCSIERKEILWCFASILLSFDCFLGLNSWIVPFDRTQILRHQMKEDAATYIAALTASEEGTPGAAGPASRRAAATAVKGGAGGGSARLRRQAATTGGKLRGSRMARTKQVFSRAIVHSAGKMSRRCRFLLI